MESPDVNMIRFLAGKIQDNTKPIAEMLELDDEQREQLRAFMSWIGDHNLEYLLAGIYYLVEIHYRNPGHLNDNVIFYLVAAESPEIAVATATLKFFDELNLHERFIKRCQAKIVILPVHNKAIELARKDDQRG